jgi:glycosyltransferase involved in cell wall biosynthesis
VHTVLLGIDASYFAPRPETPRHVLAVGKDLARDFRTFVDAVEGVDVPVEIAAYPRNLRGIRLPPNVRARRVDAAELRELYAAAACVVVPQRRPAYVYGSEGGGLTTMLEAMAMARPIVLTDRPILHDYVEEGQTALFVPPEDPSALREAIEQVLSRRDLAGALGAAARERVETGLTTRHFAAGIAPVLRAAAEGLVS